MMSKAHAQTLVALTINVVATLQAEGMNDALRIAEDLVGQLISEADTTYQGLWETIDQRYLLISKLAEGFLFPTWILAFQSRYDADDAWQFRVSESEITLLQSGNISVT